MIYLAHILPLEDGTQKMQTVAEHCRSSAGIATFYLLLPSMGFDPY